MLVRRMRGSQCRVLVRQLHGARRGLCMRCLLTGA